MSSIYLVTNLINQKSYVGKTKYSVEKRWKRHIATSRNSSKSILHKAIRKYTSERFHVQVLATNVPEYEIDAMETIWIFLMNTYVPNGYNMTKGGEGGLDLCKKSRNKQIEKAKQQWKDPEYRKKLSQGLKARWADPEYRKAREAVYTKEYRQNMREAQLRRELNPKYKETMRKKVYDNPEFRSKVSLKAKKVSNRPEAKKRLSELNKKQWSDPKFRQRAHNRQSKLIKKLWKDPEYRAKIVASLRSNPNRFEICRKAGKASHNPK